MTCEYAVSSDQSVSQPFSSLLLKIDLEPGMTEFDSARFRLSLKMALDLGRIFFDPPHGDGCNLLLPTHLNYSCRGRSSSVGNAS